MANPKKKHTPMRTRMRRSANFKLGAEGISQDPKTGEFFLSHRISPSGFYRGELIHPPKAPKKKSEGQ